MSVSMKTDRIVLFGILWNCMCTVKWQHKYKSRPRKVSQLWFLEETFEENAFVLFLGIIGHGSIPKDETRHTDFIFLRVCVVLACLSVLMMMMKIMRSRCSLMRSSILSGFQEEEMMMMPYDFLSWLSQFKYQLLKPVERFKFQLVFDRISNQILCLFFPLILIEQVK